MCQSALAMYEAIKTWAEPSRVSFDAVAILAGLWLLLSAPSLLVYRGYPATEHIQASATAAHVVAVGQEAERLVRDGKEDGPVAWIAAMSAGSETDRIDDPVLPDVSFSPESQTRVLAWMRGVILLQLLWILGGLIALWALPFSSASTAGRDLVCSTSPVLLPVHPLEALALFFGTLLFAEGCAWLLQIPALSGLVDGYVLVVYAPFLIGAVWWLKPPGGVRFAAGLWPIRVPGAVHAFVLFGAIDIFVLGVLAALFYDPLTADVSFSVALWAGGGPGSLALVVLGAVVGAPLLEELGFRMLLYGSLRRFVPMGWSAVASAALFAMTHSVGPHYTASVFVGGVVYALAYEHSRSLLVPIALHAVHNALGLCIELVLVNA